VQDIITVTHDLLKKMEFLGKSLDEFSLDTVRMFYNDARNAGFTLWRRNRRPLRQRPASDRVRC